MMRLKKFPMRSLLMLAMAGAMQVSAQTAAPAAPNTTGPSASGVNNALLYAVA